MNAALEAALSQSGLQARPSPGAMARVEQYLELRSRWSQTHNIAGPRSRSGAGWTDVLDGVAVWTALHPTLALVDVGAGSGVPGLVVAAIEPEREIHLVEPLAKRSAFLRTVVRVLDLGAVRVHRTRWPCDVGVDHQVASRAVVSPEAWPDLARSGGDTVRSVLRLLARKRPPAGLDAWTLEAAVDYQVDEVSRRVERWDRPDLLAD